MNKNEFEKQVWNSSFNQTAKLIALAVSSHGDWDTGLNVKPSLTRVAGMAGCTRDTAKKYVEALEEQGWIKYVKTHQNNVREYALQEVVAEPIGILAKTKRKQSESQLSNLSATGCRKEEVGLPKEPLPVADTLCTTLPLNLTIEPYSNLTNESPVADAPVASSDIKDDENREEEVSFDKIKCIDALLITKKETPSLTEEDYETLKGLVLDPNFRRSVAAPFLRVHEGLLEMKSMKAQETEDDGEW